MASTSSTKSNSSTSSTSSTKSSTSSSSSSSTSTCGVCCELFNKSTRRPISCGFCAFESCVSCTKEYLLGSVHDPHCMGCRKAWNREFMDASMTQTFMTKEYKKHREDVLMDRERSLLPATMSYVEDLKVALKITEEMGPLQEKLVKIRQDRVRANDHDHEAQTTVEAIEASCARAIEHETTRIRIVHLGRIRSFLAGKGDALEARAAGSEARRFVRACPAEGCRGFLSSQWKCGMCELWACPDCHEVIGATKGGHTCKPENVESAKLIAKDSRPCPCCASMIFKIEGCDQMFCVQCHTAFSWRTGKVESGRIHNPHYYDIMRQRNGGVIPREPGDQECGVPQATRMQLCLTKALRSSGPFVKDALSAIQLHNHVEHVQGQGVQGRAAGAAPNNRDLRAKYIMGDITDLKFRALLQQREKRYERTKETRFTLAMFTTALGDMLHRLAAIKAEAEATGVLKEIEELKAYTNNCLEKIGVRYKSKVKLIVDWTY